MKLNILTGVGTSSPQGGNAPLTPFILGSFKKNWYQVWFQVADGDLKPHLNWEFRTLQGAELPIQFYSKLLLSQAHWDD